ncbi:4Fe-4S binding protein [Streptomyces sp. NPDC091412]|uniref:4Fe-4S binding protein n=1 Tax=Streptomyces sp. NPDC091412 TaxID=3366002 RepID=UPI0038003487
MTYVITQNCCNDASCVPVCPVNCIHPTPEEPGYSTTEMLYIDPDGCIDCGACLDACPVNAIEPDYDLPAESMPFLELNAAYYRDPAHRDYDPAPYKEPAPRTWKGAPAGPLKVAVVGTGPAASYAVQHLLSQRGVDITIDVFERLLTPWGLVRFGVAPDHLSTKNAAEPFGRALRSRNVRVFLDVTVGEDVTHEQLAERYHAVVYGVGASRDRRLEVEGEDLPGSHAATDFVGWYNGHPDHAASEFDIAVERAVIVGNGNVALDVARVLAKDPEALVATDIAEHALEALRASSIKEIRVVARRGADASAFTTPELIGLKEALGPRLIRSADLGALGAGGTPLDRYKRELIEGLPTEVPDGDRPVVVLDYCKTPIAVVGDERVEAVRFARTQIDPETGSTSVTDGTEDVSAGLVIRSVGYRALPIKDLPFDEQRAVVPNERGRVVDPSTGTTVPGAFVTGWVKRGPSGVIGTNRRCARETVDVLLEDWEAGRLGGPADSTDVASILPRVTDLEAWKSLDAQERTNGRAAGRPRVKVVDRDAQLAVIAAALSTD